MIKTGEDYFSIMSEFIYDYNKISDEFIDEYIELLMKQRNKNISTYFINFGYNLISKSLSLCYFDRKFPKLYNKNIVFVISMKITNKQINDSINDQDYDKLKKIFSNVIKNNISKRSVDVINNNYKELVINKSIDINTLNSNEIFQLIHTNRDYIDLRLIDFRKLENSKYLNVKFNNNDYKYIILFGNKVLYHLLNFLYKNLIMYEGKIDNEDIVKLIKKLNSYAVINKNTNIAAINAFKKYIKDCIIQNVNIGFIIDYDFLTYINNNSKDFNDMTIIINSKPLKVPNKLSVLFNTDCNFEFNNINYLIYRIIQGETIPKNVTITKKGESELRSRLNILQFTDPKLEGIFSKFNIVDKLSIPVLEDENFVNTGRGN